MWLYYPIQRYKFESNSQHIRRTCQVCSCCIIRYKDTNLKAIHNRREHITDPKKVVLSDTKIQIWKQFTTLALKGYLDNRCIIRYKDTNLKAIHNSFFITDNNGEVVLSDTKIQIWKQFTTGLNEFNQFVVLYYPIQRYKFESNSQLYGLHVVSWDSCIIRYKDTNLKAIHNSNLKNIPLVLLYYPIQRYKFESNSQRL